MSKSGDRLRPYGGRPLSLLDAAARGHTASALRFIDEGVDVDSRGKYGETALHWAAARGDRELVHRLLRAGASTNRPDVSGTLPHEVAAEFGDGELELMLDRVLQHELSMPGWRASHLSKESYHGR